MPYGRQNHSSTLPLQVCQIRLSRGGLLFQVFQVCQIRVSRGRSLFQVFQVFQVFQGG